MPGLSHSTLRRVLQSLVTATISGLYGGVSQRRLPTTSWSDGVLFGELGEDALGCDSLELLQVSSAVNEMFHLHEAAFETRLLGVPSFGAWLNVIEDAWESGVDHMTVSTSGSSGRPKLCTHTFASLDTEAAFLADLFGSRCRIVAYTPAHHIYGLLFTGLLPDRLGIPVVPLQSVEDGLPATDGARSTLWAGDLVVSFPDGWSWMDRSIRTVPADVEGVTSTAPCPRELIDSLMNGRLSRFVEVYGSSETAGIGTRIWPDPRYRLMPHLAFIDSGASPSCEIGHCSGQRIELMDQLQRFDDDTFLVTGRKDACVQVGGVNVSPSAMEERLRGHPGIAEVSVRLMRPEEGRRLKCFLVPDVAVEPERLGESVRTEVASWPAAERPMAIRFGDALPRNSAGKLADW